MKTLGVPAALIFLALGHSAQAHHVAFCQSVIEAVEKPDVATVRHLFDEAIWDETEEGMSAEELQARLTQGVLTPLRTSSDLKFEEYSSYDKFGYSLRCVLTFRIEINGTTTQVFLLAKRVRDDGFRNPKAWQIWRIVTDTKLAEFFLGRKIHREASVSDNESAPDATEPQKLQERKQK